MATRVSLPKLTYEMEEGHILEWLFEEGDEVAVGEPLFVVETDKAAVEVPAEQAGTLLKILVPAGETVAVGTLLAWMGKPGDVVLEEEGASATPVPAAPAPDRAAPSGGSAVPPPAASPVAPARPVAASPVAKRLARELGVDLAAVQQQVGDKRIREADVRAYAEEQKAPAGRDGGGGEAAFDLLELTPLQRTMASHLSQAAAIPQSAAACQVDLTNLKELRSEMLATWNAKHGLRLSYTHILAALVVRALKACPKLNASWTEEGIRLYQSVHLGVAMASERGLVVPVVHDAQDLDLFKIATEIVRLQRATETNRLLPGDLRGGTFTITNVGMLGIPFSIPLLNPPQSAILGIGAEQSKVVMEGNRLWVAPVAWVTVASDHRVVDGAAMGAFLRELKTLIENPRPALVT